MIRKDDPGVQLYRAREGFGVPGPDGFMRAYATGALISGDDPIATTHRALLEPASNSVEAATAEPGERRLLRLPSGVRQRQAVEHHTGTAHDEAPAHVRVPTLEGGPDMVHALPPEHPMSPASTFAPEQPGRGVVADDVSDEQNTAGAETADEAQAKDAKVRRGGVKVAAGGNKGGGTIATGGEASKDKDEPGEPDATGSGTKAAKD